LEAKIFDRQQELQYGYTTNDTVDIIIYWGSIYIYNYIYICYIYVYICMYIDIEIIGGHGYIHGKNPSKLGVGIRGPSNNGEIHLLELQPKWPKYLAPFPVEPHITLKAARGTWKV